MRFLITLDNMPDQDKEKISAYIGSEGEDVTLAGSLADLVGKIRSGTLRIEEYGAVLPTIGSEKPPMHDGQEYAENINYLREKCMRAGVLFAINVHLCPHTLA
jgi:hypothetical protein